MTSRSTRLSIAAITETTDPTITTTTTKAMETEMATEMATETAPICPPQRSPMKHRMNCVRYTALLVLLAFAGAASAQDHAPATFASAGFGSGTGFGSGAAGPIGAGDLVEMSVFDTPELSGKLRVSNTGNVILPLVGTLHLQGLTAGEAQTLIRQKLVAGNFLKDPQVTVFISEYATQNVSVMGEVHTPGV